MAAAASQGFVFKVNSPTCPCGDEVDPKNDEQLINDVLVPCRTLRLISPVV